MKLTHNLKLIFPLTAGLLCASAGLFLTACERHDTSTPQGAAEDASQSIRDAGRDAADKLRDATNHSTTKEIKRGAEDAADKLRDAAKDAGRAIERTGEDLKRQSQ